MIEFSFKPTRIKNRMKIVLIGNGQLPIPPTGWGAVEIILWDLSQYLINIGHDVRIVNTTDINKVINQTNSFRPDIVHLHSLTFIDTLKFLNCKRKIITCHDTARQDIESFKKCIASECSIAVLSDRVYQEYVKLGCDKSRLYVIPNGIDSKRFKFDETCVYPNRSIYLGTIDERKRQYLYQSIDSIYFAGPKWDSNFTEEARYMGQWDKDTVYTDLTKNANLVLLSANEVHPLVVSEALVCGLGVVVSEAASANLDRSMSWITVIPDDKLNNIQFVESKIIENRNISIQNRMKIRQHALKTVSWDIRMANIMTMYNNVL